MQKYLGIDIGGTAVKLGVVNEAGAVLARTERSVSFDNYQTPILTTVLAAARDFTAAQGLAAGNYVDLAGIGVSATGQVDNLAGTIAGTGGNFPGWVNAPVRAELERQFHCAVSMANDANCMVLGEVWTGAAKGYSDVIGITLGTGVGGGIVTGGRLLEGARGLAGEIGHLRIHQLDGLPCGCGARGCYEKYAATTALVREAMEIDAARYNSGRDVFEGAAAGDRVMLELLDRWQDEIVGGLASLVHIFNPQLVLVGGGVSAQQDLLIEPLAQKLKATVMPAFAEGLELRAAALKNDAGLVGAVYHFLQEHKQ